MGLTAASGVVMTPVAGVASDRVGRKPVLLVVLGVKVAATLCNLCGLRLRSISFFSIARVASIGTLVVLVSAWVSDATAGAARVRAQGLVMSGFAVALVAGPAFGTALSHVGGADLVLLCSFFAASLSLAAATSLPAPTPPLQLAVGRDLGRELYAAAAWRASARRLAQDRFLFGVVAAFALIKLGSINAHSLFAMYVKHRFGWRSREIGAAMAGFGLLIGASYYTCSRWSSRRPRVQLAVIFGGPLLAAAANVLYGMATSVAAFFAAGAVASAAAAVQPVLNAKVSALAAPESGFALGCVNALQSLLEIPVTPLLGHLLGRAIEANPADPAAAAVGVPFLLNSGAFLAGAVILVPCHASLGHARAAWVTNAVDGAEPAAPPAVTDTEGESPRKGDDHTRARTPRTPCKDSGA